IDPGNYILIVSKEGYEIYRNEIKVSDKITNNLQIPLESLSDKNTPPVKPILTYPSNNVVVEFESINFRWNSSDLDNDVLTYDFYLSKKSESLKLVASDLNSSTFQNINVFEDGTTYQWQVVVKDKYSSVSSVINTFIYKKSDIGNIDNLIGYWKFDDNPLDSGPNSYNGLHDGVTYVSDRKGVPNSAANFNGIPGLSKSLVSCSNKIQFAEIFSVSFWLNPANSLGSNSDSFYDCISKWGGSS
ncbi:MAG: PEGA domain-containing protein, partial [Candidatus Kapaibacterium sp.]